MLGSTRDPAAPWPREYPAGDAQSRAPGTSGTFYPGPPWTTDPYGASQKPWFSPRVCTLCFDGAFGGRRPNSRSTWDPAFSLRRGLFEEPPVSKGLGWLRLLPASVISTPWLTPLQFIYLPHHCFVYVRMCRYPGSRGPGVQGPVPGFGGRVFVWGLGFGFLASGSGRLKFGTGLVCSICPNLSHGNLRLRAGGENMISVPTVPVFRSCVRSTRGPHCPSSNLTLRPLRTAPTSPSAKHVPQFKPSGLCIVFCVATGKPMGTTGPWQ